MTIELPDPIPLSMPPGDAEAMADLARDIAAAGRCLAAVDARISDPADCAPGWLGQDASAAAAQVLEVTMLVRRACDAEAAAADRLAQHAERLLDARSHVRALKHEQDQEFADAWRRWGSLPDLQLQVMTGAPGARAIVDELVTRERGRQRRHTALLEEIEDDAAATARVFDDACAAVGGHDPRGDTTSVVAYLAAQLPGWGDLELARRGRALAAEFATVESGAERESLSRRVLPFAGSAAFAEALLAGLGVAGMRFVLEVLGDGLLGPDSAFARVMAQALGAAASTASTAVREVLDTEYVPPATVDGRIDLAVLGMGTLLAASLALGSRGVAARTVASWGRQIALRDRRLGGTAADRAEAGGTSPRPVDPLAMVVADLAARRDAEAGASFLNGTGVWTVLLARPWSDGGASLAQLLRTAAAVPGRHGDDAVRGGLEAVGSHLEDGDAHDWPVDPATVRALSSALADALATHVSLAGAALSASAEHGLSTSDAAMLRGLGSVTVDRQAAAVVAAALERWVAAQPVPDWRMGPPPAFPAIVVPNAYLAVQQYGQHLDRALHEIDLERQAADRAFLWNATAGLAAQLAPGPWGSVAGVVADYVAMWADMDGTWEAGPDHSLTFHADVPAPEALQSLSPDEFDRVNTLADQAKASFMRTASSLGVVDVPVSAAKNWWAPIESAATIGPGDALDVATHAHGHVPPIR